MNLTVFKVYLAVVVLAMLFIGACSPTMTPPSPDMAAGVYVQSGYEFFRWDEGLSIMIWHDGTISSACGSSGSTTRPMLVIQCHAISKKDHRFDWRLETDDGITAKFSIDNTDFDLGDGNLFIISTASGETVVKQLQRDLSNVKAISESIVGFGLMDDDVKAFIQPTPSN
ncbi:MAG: hypothetical protein GTO14_24050 [Anaerolineales bacterium]|nr:hypothetical protein [Anaerolineales bacterium]